MVTGRSAWAQFNVTFKLHSDVDTRQPIGMEDEYVECRLCTTKVESDQIIPPHAPRFSDFH